jgi:iron complex transport system substrate-binding protein
MQPLLVLLCFVFLLLPAHASQTVTDDLGRQVVLPRSPQRIVSLAPSVTEILYAIGAGRKVVGDTVFCDFPPAAKRLPHIGGPITPSAEKILVLHPDLIVLADQTLPASEADMLAARWRTPVYVTAAATYAGVERDIAALGALVGEPKATLETLRRMRNTEKGVRRAVLGHAKPRVFVVVWGNPLMTAGGNSFIGDLIRMAGGINIAEHSSQSYPTYSPERLLREQPDIVLTGIDHATLTFPGAAALTAMKQRRVFAVLGDWTDRPGPRLGLGLRAVAKALHPEGFQK